MTGHPTFLNSSCVTVDRKHLMRLQSETPVFKLLWRNADGPPREYSQENWVGVCGPLPKTLTLFMTKICDIPYPIYNLTKNSKPYL